MNKYIFKSKGVAIRYGIVIFLVAIILVLQASILQYLTAAATSFDVKKTIFWAVILILYLFVDGFVDYLRGKWRNALVQETMFHLRNDFTKMITGRSIHKFKEKNDAYYVSKMTNDMGTIENEYLTSILIIAAVVVSFIFAIANSFYLQPALTFIILGLSAFPLLTPYLATKMLSDKKNKELKAKEKMLTQFSEMLQGFTTLKFFSSFPFIFNKFQKDNDDVRIKTRQTTSSQAAVYGISYSLSGIVYFGAWAIGAVFVAQGKLDLPKLIAMTKLASMIAGPIQTIGQEYTTVVSSKKVADDMVALVDGSSQVIEPHQVSQDISEIILQDISFVIEDKKVLENINFTFEAGKKYAIVGESGSGKSSFMKIISGVNYPTSGEMLINGVSVDKNTIENYYPKMNIVEQETTIFDGDLQNNVTMFHEEYSEEDIIAAMEKGQLVKWIPHLHDEDVANLSGGEKRRVDITRSILARKNVILLDEPTTGLDKQTAEQVEDEIFKLPANIVIVITHNDHPEYLKKFDAVIRMNAGSIE